MQQWEEVDRSSFQSQLIPENLAAMGSYGSVYRVFWRRRTCALKAISAAKDERRVQALSEIQTAATLRHSNLVPFLAASTSQSPFYIITQWMDGGDLASYLKNEYPEGMPRALVAQLAMDVLEALIYLHARGLIHRDLKPHNILLSNDDKHLTASLLGSGCMKVESVESVVGTYIYMAPEMLMEETEKYSTAMNIYSFGVLLYEMLFGSYPYQHIPVVEMAQKVVRGERPPIPQVGSKWKELIERCWAQSPEDRPTAEEARDMANSLLQEEK